MRRVFAFLSAGLISGLGLLSASASELTSSPAKGQIIAPKPAPEVCTTGTCGGNYGTTVQFVSTPSVAARQALKEQKLVFVLHVSGLFENPDFT